MTCIDYLIVFSFQGAIITAGKLLDYETSDFAFLEVTATTVGRTADRTTFAKVGEKGCSVLKFHCLKCLLEITAEMMES